MTNDPYDYSGSPNDVWHLSREVKDLRDEIGCAIPFLYAILIAGAVAYFSLKARITALESKALESPAAEVQPHGR